MRRSEKMLIAIALFVAITVSVIVYRMLSLHSTQPEQRPVVQKQAPQTKQVLVASKAIEIGEPVSGAIRVDEWPEETSHTGFILREQMSDAKLKEYIARRPIQANEPISESAIINKDDHGVLSAILKSGMRALTVNVDSASLSSGLIVPGNIVDVVVAYSNPKKAEETPSQTILCGVRVLAINQQLIGANPPEKTAQPPQGPTTHVVTLEVEPQEVEGVIAATKAGTISLSLHSSTNPHDEHCELPSSHKPDPVKVYRAEASAGQPQPTPAQTR